MRYELILAAVLLTGIVAGPTAVRGATVLPYRGGRAGEKDVPAAGYATPEDSSWTTASSSAVSSPTPPENTYHHSYLKTRGRATRTSECMKVFQKKAKKKLSAKTLAPLSSGMLVSIPDCQYTQLRLSVIVDQSPKLLHATILLL